MIVIDKPAGLIVHPGAGHPDGTLVNGLLHRYPEIADVGDPARPGIVHRLDANTSGLLAVARTPVAYDALVAALAARTVDRGYLALVWGVPDAAQWPGRRADRSFGPPPDAHGGARGWPPGAHPRTRSSARSRPARQPVALHARDRAHAPDPRAPRRDPAPGRRRSRVRRDPRRARDRSPVPPRGDARLRASGDAASRSSFASELPPELGVDVLDRARRLTTRSTVRFTTSSVLRRSRTRRTGVLPASVPAVSACTVANAKSPKLLRWTACHNRRGMRRWSSDVSSIATSR